MTYKAADSSLDHSMSEETSEFSGSERSCPHGHPVEAGAVFCHRCGISMLCPTGRLGPSRGAGHAPSGSATHSPGDIPLEQVSDESLGPGWWRAHNGGWYPPHADRPSPSLGPRKPTRTGMSRKKHLFVLGIVAVVIVLSAFVVMAVSKNSTPTKAGTMALTSESARDSEVHGSNATPKTVSPTTSTTSTTLATTSTTSDLANHSIAAQEAAVSQEQLTVANDEALVEQDSAQIQQLTSQYQSENGAYVTAVSEAQGAARQLENSGGATGQGLAGVQDQSSAQIQTDETQLATTNTALSQANTKYQLDEAATSNAQAALQVGEDLLSSEQG
jgi:hypothetical protein